MKPRQQRKLIQITKLIELTRARVIQPYTTSITIPEGPTGAPPVFQILAKAKRDHDASQT